MVTPRREKAKKLPARSKTAGLRKQTSTSRTAKTKPPEATPSLLDGAQETTAPAEAAPIADSRSRRGRARGKSQKDAHEGHATDVRIVGIGASAGGLEALELFFDGMPVDSGLAFIVVQHLSPDFRSMMDELLARHSKMPIRHATDGMVFDPNTIYLNPPRQNLVIVDGRLRLRPVDDEQVPNLPIDAFFVSLAQELAEKAIGVILSGTGSDGTRGAEAIKRAGGTVFVQDPDTAKFQNMPRSAIERGVATVTAPPRDMGLLLYQLSRGEPLHEKPPPQRELEPDAEILRQLERRFGVNFSYYKKSTVGRRLRRRALLNGLQDLANYATLLSNNPAELEYLYADLLIGVTAFFRDKSAFDSLSKNVIPRLAAQMTSNRQLRIWVAGCASGEEPYSIAILLSEYAREHSLPLNVKIFATDIHYGSLEKAGLGVYSAATLKEMPDTLRDRYFDREGEHFQVKTSLRRLIVFSRHSLIKDPPFNHLDLITCRNLLIYLDDTAQRKVLAHFHFALVKDGVLFLGPSESTGTLQEEFDLIDSRWRIFRKSREVHLPELSRMLPAINLPVDAAIVEKMSELTLRTGPSSPSRPPRTDRRELLRAYDALLAKYAPVSLLVSRDGELLHIFGDASRYLEHKPGLFSARVDDLIIAPLKLTITACLEGPWLKQNQAFTREVVMRSDQGRDIVVEIKADVLQGHGVTWESLLISLSERAIEPKSKSSPPKIVQRIEERAAQQARIDDLERSLHFTEESLQTTIEELETSNEELQSTNEELMSANEELQSTNEELHAVNEELYSVSSEHQRKIDELLAITADMDHLLRCTDVGTIFLDQDLRVRRFTPAVARSFNLLDRDIGRPIAHITARFSYPGLEADVAKVATTGKLIEQAIEVEDISLLLRIFPFKVDDVIRGIVITLIDVSSLIKQAERALELRNQELARLNSSLEQFTYIVSHDLRAPLRTILNSAKWIEEDLGDAASDDVREHTKRLMTYTKRLTDMLTDLLAYARLGSMDAAQVEDVDLEAMLHSVADSLDNESRLDLTCTSALKKFTCHRAPLLLVFQNLLDNALKYSDQERVAVRVSAEDIGTHLKFSVADDGPGIPQRHHEKVFLPFRKLENGQDKPGTGMGLALVKKAVQDNGGEIEIVSDPTQQRGTEFHFTWTKIAKRTE